MLTESPMFVKWEGKNAPDHISLVNRRILLYLPRSSADVSLPAIIGYAVNWGLQRKGGIYRKGWKMNSQLLEKRPHLISSSLAAIMLLLALAPWPYGYYQVLRLVVCGVSVYTAFVTYQWGKLWATWVFGFIAILFNPLIPIHLSRELWQPIDVICALMFTVVAITLKKPVKTLVEHNEKNE